MQTSAGNQSRHGIVDVAIIGGGLGGLSAATLLARAGKRVQLFEKARLLGGRAATHVHGEYRFNLGPHALYRRGAAKRLFTELGLSFSGGVPSAAGGYAVAGGVKHTMPGGFVSLLTTSLLRLPGKFEVARLLGTLQKLDATAVEGLSVREWLDTRIRQPDVRDFVQALFRLSTYANDPERQSAGSALSQLQMALSSNVDYLDGGWQVMVDALRVQAEAAGAQIQCGARAVGVDHGAAVRAVHLADGSRVAAAAVVVAGTPAEAIGVVSDSRVLQQWAAAAIPVKAACLDIALSRLPDPQVRFALGIDAPLYFSVHSAVAKLAAAGGATIHVAKYLDPAKAPDPTADERQLETLLDLMQPGWRAVVVERRFLPSMVVYHALVTAAARGTAGRPGPAVPGIDGLFVVGDWVGPEGALADASVASAQQAAEMIMRRGTSRVAVAA